MGDIIDMEITIHGQIKTAEALKALAEAMSKDIYEFEENVGSARQRLLDANLEDKGLVLKVEVNNGTVDEMKKAAIKHKIDITVFADEGPGWGASTYFVRNGTASFNLPVVDREIAVTTEVIDKLMSRGLTELTQLREFIDIFKNAGDLPRFSVADEVITEMFLPKRDR